MSGPNFQVVPNFPEHGKVRRLGDERIPAMGLWMACGAWSVANSTRGFVPREVVTRYGNATVDTLHLADLLVAENLWVEKEIGGEEGYVFHDWDDVNADLSAADRKRNATRRRVQRYRERQRAADQAAYEEIGNASNALQGVTGGVTGNALQGVTDPPPPGSPPHTPPLQTPPTGGSPGSTSSPGSSGSETLPDAKSRRGSSSSKGTRLPDDWWPSPSLQQWATENGPNLRGKGMLAIETEQFKDWAAAAPGEKGVRKDWDATYRTWIRRRNREEAGGATRTGRGGVGSPARSTTDERIAALDRFKSQPEQPQLELDG